VSLAARAPGPGRDIRTHRGPFPPIGPFSFFRHEIRFGYFAIRDRITPNGMPLYEYISADGNGCRVCNAGFELRRPADRAPLAACPLCRAPVKKRISRINTPRITKPFSTSDAKAAGFTILERRDKGVYEKL